VFGIGSRNLLMAMSVGVVGCGVASDQGAVKPSYDSFTGRLVQLSADQDGDGRPEQWTYVDGNRVLRGEKDSDGDGRIDRWEYFGTKSELRMVGTSSRNDGSEDTWTWVSRIDGEGRVDLSTARDRHIDRREFYLDTTLARAELDTNTDGHVDRWDRYESAVLREVQFDTSFAGATADRRLLYDAQGRFTGAEADDDRDGRFERLAPGGSATSPGEIRK
jgi:hypothetical protein